MFTVEHYDATGQRLGRDESNGGGRHHGGRGAKARENVLRTHHEGHRNRPSRAPPHRLHPGQ